MKHDILSRTVQTNLRRLKPKCFFLQQTHSYVLNNKDLTCGLICAGVMVTDDS